MGIWPNLPVAAGLAAALAAGIAGCGSIRAGDGRADSVFDPGQLAKTDIDRVAEAHRAEVFRGLRVLAEKLYRRNPREWRKGGSAGLEAAVDRLFDPRLAWRLPELEGRTGVDAVRLAFGEDYRGDRVAALVGGLGGMAHAAFNEKNEFFVIDDLDPQKLYNAARNMEVAAWKLASSRGPDGLPLLLSNEMAPVHNLSFEREFGRLIANLDTLSRIMEDKTRRTVVKVIQTLATAVFLPVPALK
ncbi:MAG: hypothetical protein JNK22_18535 [Rhodocyclaceae bacterium]|nr:hypothetical protein [Rhodocyclaceae bacterium]